MTIKENQNGSVYEIAVEGQLDSTTVPEFEECIQRIPADTTEVIYDFTELEYIASAGLRALLLANTLLGDECILTVKGANEMILDIFNVTGFSEMLNII